MTTAHSIRTAACSACGTENIADTALVLAGSLSRALGLTVECEPCHKERGCPNPFHNHPTLRDFRDGILGFDQWRPTIFTAMRDIEVEDGADRQAEWPYDSALH